MPRARTETIRRILVTAGPTREMLDPVRFITNLSTGEMGYAIARQARERGFQVTLISGPTALTPPKGVRFIPIVTVEELRRALQKNFFRHDVLIMSAAVGDFLPARRSLKKIPRQKRWRVDFKQAPDLIHSFAKKKGNRVVIGFSLETGNWLERSRNKQWRKNLDGIVANYYSSRHNPFGRTRAHVALVEAETIRILRLGSKSQLARRVIDWVLALAAARRSKN